MHGFINVVLPCVLPILPLMPIVVARLHFPFPCINCISFKDRFIV